MRTYSTFSRPTQPPGYITITSTSNNTIATLTNSTGQTLIWTSAGVLGFRNSRKSTTIGAQAVGEYMGTHAKNHGIHRVYVRVKGLGYGKDTCIRALGGSGVDILSITDTTPIAHNGCRRPRARRT